MPYQMILIYQGKYLEFHKLHPLTNISQELLITIDVHKNHLIWNQTEKLEISERN